MTRATREPKGHGVYGKVMPMHLMIPHNDPKIAACRPLWNEGCIAGTVDHDYVTCPDCKRIIRNAARDGVR
jgi:hypothetical protein